MKRDKVKVKGTPNPAPEAEHRLSGMGRKAPVGDAQEDFDRSAGIYRKKKLGISQHPTEPKEGFADDAGMGPPLRGWF